MVAGCRSTKSQPQKSTLAIRRRLVLRRSNANRRCFDMAYEFRTLKTAIRFYHLVTALRLPRRKLKEQLVTAAESVCLQLAEGNRRDSQQDRLCFFNRALTSVKEA